MSEKIVVLDAKPLDAGDLDWDALRALGDATLFDDTDSGEVNARIADAQFIFTNKVKLSADAFEAAPKLQMVGVLATGFDIIDIEAARENNVTVCNVPSYSSNFTAQTTWALLLELAHHVGLHSQGVRDGEWQKADAFSFWKTPLVELDGKTLAVVGLGKIGSQVARVAQAMGMKVIAAQLPGREKGSEDGIEYLALEDAFRRADVISLHCPFTDETREIINQETLGWMKPTALLINTSRGLLVDEAVLSRALENQQIAGYAADVLSSEPPSNDNPLLSAPRCIITPHFAWASLESRQRLQSVSIENLRAFQNGEPQNVVS